MKPRIYFDGWRWVLLCQRRLRSFDTFGSTREERIKLERLPQRFPTLEAACDELRGLYRARLIIR